VLFEPEIPNPKSQTAIPRFVSHEEKSYQHGLYWKSMVIVV
jgi:hypothetical protein